MVDVYAAVQRRPGEAERSRRRPWSWSPAATVSNLVTQMPPLVEAISSHQSLSKNVVWASLNLTYYAILSTAALAPSKRVVAGTLIAAIALVTGAAAASSTFFG